MPLEKLQAMIIKNQDEKLALIEQRENLVDGDEDDLMGDDPEMIDQKLFVCPSWYIVVDNAHPCSSSLISKRLKDLKAALANRSHVTPAHTRYAPPSFNSNLASNPPSVSCPTPNPTDGHIRQSAYQTPTLRTERGPNLLSDDSFPALRSINHLESHVLGPDQENVPPSAILDWKATMIRRQSTRTPSPPLEDLDINVAKEDLASNETLPPSTPPRAVTSQQSSRQSPKAGPASRKAGLAELRDAHVEAFCSSPVRTTPNRPPRAEASSARSILGGPCSSISAAARGVQARKAVIVDIQHPWSREVDQKLRQVFKLPRFRTHQKEAINVTMAGKDGKQK